MRAFATIAALALGLAACFTLDEGGLECQLDSDCVGSCTRTGECASGTLIDARITWTIDGVAPTPGDDLVCAGIDHLSVAFEDYEQQGGIVFEPVPCELGQITYDKMPPRLDSVIVGAYTADDATLDEDAEFLRPGENRIEINLVP